MRTDMKTRPIWRFYRDSGVGAKIMRLGHWGT